ncbi:MAG: hypothetical protein QM703_26010 [Gemmatales bacterium]
MRILAELIKAKEKLNSIWYRLYSSTDEVLPITAYSKVPDWCIAAVELMILSDIASAGIGFKPMEDGKIHSWSDVYITEVRSYYRDDDEIFDQLLTVDEYPLGTVAKGVSPKRARILPKARTPQSGITLRSMSFNLALLPGNMVVNSKWLMSSMLYNLTTPDLVSEMECSKLNLLLIPFPYNISPEDFVQAGHSIDDNVRKAKKEKKTPRFFTIKQNWIPKNKEKEVASLIMKLVHKAEDDLAKAGVADDVVNGVVMPEVSLTLDVAKHVSDSLLEHSRTGFFICGITQNKQGSKINGAYVAMFDRNWKSKHKFEMIQCKQHRWKLDDFQIKKYGLNFPEGFEWWEQIDVSHREVYFHLFSAGSFVTFVCEDLARAEPLHHIVRSVGPNLVFALLLDSQQILSRWPGRYATTLADDPGCACISFTSQGLIKLDKYYQEELKKNKSEELRVGLWRSGNELTEINMPNDSNSLAVLLRLKSKRITEYSLDDRNDGGVAETWNTNDDVSIIKPVHIVKLDKKPKWLHIKK